MAVFALYLALGGKNCHVHRSWILMTNKAVEFYSWDAHLIKVWNKGTRKNYIKIDATDLYPWHLSRKVIWRGKGSGLLGICTHIVHSWQEPYAIKRMCREWRGWHLKLHGRTFNWDRRIYIQMILHLKTTESRSLQQRSLFPGDIYQGYWNRRNSNRIRPLLRELDLCTPYFSTTAARR